MRELELKEKKIKEIQSTGDRLLREDHPARPTVEVGEGWGAVGSPWCPQWGYAGEPLGAHDGGRGLQGSPGLWWGH